MNFLVLSLILALVVVATICDLRDREVPDWISLTILAWAVLAATLGWTTGGWLSLVYGFSLGLVLSASVFYMGGLGGGDVKLIAALGAAVGPLGLLVVLFWMALTGAILALVAMSRGKKDFAYVPAIAVGLMVYLAFLGSMQIS